MCLNIVKLMRKRNQVKVMERKKNRRKIYRTEISDIMEQTELKMWNFTV
jgi:hypothetical protein